MGNMRTEKISVNEIKIRNRRMIYQYIRAHGPVSKQELVIGLKLSLPTVTQNLGYLKEQGLIDDSRWIENTGGRNAAAYTCIGDARLAIGVYLTAHHMNAVAMDLSGNVAGLVRERIAFNLDDEAYLKRLGKVVEQVKNEARIADEKLLGVGIAVPGLVSDDGSLVTYGMTLGFTGKRLCEIAKYIPYQSKLAHDSYAAGYMEIWNGRRPRNAFYISLSNSVGGSVIIDGGIYAGDTQKGGEIGHMTVVPEGGELCYCGKRGCFDTLCRAGNLDQYTDGNLDEFFQLLKAGDQKAGELWDTYLDHLSQAVYNMRILFDTDIILGGYVGAYIGDYMEELYRRVDARNPFSDRARDYLFPCQFKVEASAAGAAIFFIDAFLNEI